MKKIKNSNLTEFSQKLRRKMTKEERHLWYDFLKALPVTIHRQKVIDRYIVDFYCASAKLVIELDGSQHFDDMGATSDKERDQFLESLGLTVKHYANDEVQNDFEFICKDINAFIFPDAK